MYTCGCVPNSIIVEITFKVICLINHSKQTNMVTLASGVLVLVSTSLLAFPFCAKVHYINTFEHHLINIHTKYSTCVHFHVCVPKPFTCRHVLMLQHLCTTSMRVMCQLGVYDTWYTNSVCTSEYTC